jgi:hypothetical protein
MTNKDSIDDDLLKMMGNIKSLSEDLKKVNNFVNKTLQDNIHIPEFKEVLSIKNADELNRKQGKEIDLDATISRYKSIIKRLDEKNK